MSYVVKELYYSLQGEGAQSGSPAVFCRFAGCNLWSGREIDRKSAICRFCDTDFVGTSGPNGGRFSRACDLAQQIAELWPSESSYIKGGTPGAEFQGNVYRTLRPLVIFTGGEPLLQLDSDLIQVVKQNGFTIAVESNGTVQAPEGIDWLTISPKVGANLVQKSGTELKLVYPQEIDPEELIVHDFDYFYLSPMFAMDPLETRHNLQVSLEYCLRHPQWRLTYQFHKFWNIS